MPLVGRSATTSTFYCSFADGSPNRRECIRVGGAPLGGVRYLLASACKRTANAHELPRIYELLDREGLGHMLICTPAEFLGGDSNDEETADS